MPVLTKQNNQPRGVPINDSFNSSPKQGTSGIRKLTKKHRYYNEWVCMCVGTSNYLSFLLRTTNYKPVAFKVPPKNQSSSSASNSSNSNDLIPPTSPPSSPIPKNYTGKGKGPGKGKRSGKGKELAKAIPREKEVLKSTNRNGKIHKFFAFAL